MKRYNKVLLQEHYRLRLHLCSFDLQAAIPEGLQLQHCQEYEKIAHLDSCACKHAAKKCRKLSMGAVPFSDSINKARGEIDMWDLLERKREGTRASTKKIRRLMHLTGISTAFNESLESILIKRKAAMSRYKGFKKNAHKLRETFGKKLIKARAKARNTTVEVQEKQLRQAFGQRALAQRVK